MKPTIAGLAALAVGCMMLGASAAAEPEFDINKPESPALPAPKWFKPVDQGANDPRLKGYFAPAGVKVEIVADFPVVTNPVGMTFGDDGTLYVLEWRPDPGNHWNEKAEPITYKDGTKRNVATMKKAVKDVVKVLRDTKGKGTYDQSEVILEEELPSSILIHDGWLYVTGRGTVRRYPLADLVGKDGNKAKAEIIAQGFCGFHHHQVSGLTIGNDGWLYITSGDDDNIVEGSDGSRATALRTGGVFRCRPDGSKMQVYSIGYRNPYRDVAFDASFNMFHVDNDNEDGSKFMGCRLMHVAEESDFGWRLRPGARCCSPDKLRGAAFGELPGKMAPMLKTGRGAPAGLLIYNETRFPEDYRDLLYYPDVYRKLIRAYKVHAKGASFEVVEEFPFLRSDDPLFRPCQMVTGPDGAMYVCDWRTDSGGAGQLSGDGKHGRIYRLSWSGTKDEAALPLRGMDSWAKIATLSDADLLKALGAPDFSDRLKAQREFVRRGTLSFRKAVRRGGDASMAKLEIEREAEKVRVPLLRMVLWPHLDEKEREKGEGNELVKEEPPATARVAALGALQSLWNDNVRDAFVRVLRDPDNDVSRLAIDALALHCKPGDRVATEALLKHLEAPEASVRRAVFLALGRLGGSEGADALANAFKFDDGKDTYLTDGLLRGIERAGKPGIAKLVALAESGDEGDHDRVLQAFLTLRTRAAAEAIPGLLKYPHLTVKQRAELILSYRNYQLDPPISLEPALDYLAKHEDAPAAVKLAGLEVLSGTSLLNSEKGQKVLMGMFDEPSAELRLAVLKAVEESRLVKAAPRVAELLANKARPLPERIACAKALRVLNDKTAVAALRDAVNTDAEGGSALRLEAFRSLAALDATTAHASAVVFLEQGDEALRKEAILVLGSQPQGAKLVAERYLAKKLPRELLPQVSEALRKHAGKDKELEKLLTEVMKGGLLVSLDKDEIARVEMLVKKEGNARRGRDVYLNSKTLACVNCHRLEGVGGNAGPDLTRIWDTHSIAKIMESIIDPSKEIKEGFTTYVATTKKGQTFTGLKVSQTPEELVLRDANAREVRIAAKELEEVAPSKQSLMPDNAIAQLSFNQFIDLVAFLKDRAAQESLQGMALDFWLVGPFGDDLKAEYAPETNADPRATYAGMKEGEKLAWQPAQAEPSGLLNLGSVFPKSKGSAYALTYVFAPKAQKVEMRVGAGDAVKVWVNGTAVHEQVGPRKPSADQDRVEINLKEGWNPVLAKVVNREGNQGLYLRFSGGQGLRVSAKP